jgi:hypothetical protein
MSARSWLAACKHIEQGGCLHSYISIPESSVLVSCGIMYASQACGAHIVDTCLLIESTRSAFNRGCQWGEVQNGYLPEETWSSPGVVCLIIYQRAAFSCGYCMTLLSRHLSNDIICHDDIMPSGCETTIYSSNPSRAYLCHLVAHREDKREGV